VSNVVYLQLNGVVTLFRIDDYPEDLIETVEVPDGAENQGSPLVHTPEATPAIASSPSSTAPSPTVSSTTSPPENDTQSSSSSLPRQPTNVELMDQCRTFLDRLKRGTAPWVVQRMRSTYGAIPTDPASFSFWVAFILPIEEQEKAKLLPIRSPRLRLLLVVHWIEQLNSNWYKERFLINWIILLIALFVSFFSVRAVVGGV